ncbi:MAG: DUF2321 domain-containing protein [Bacteroidetes bacterium]|nr:DUF2321 domain-containing protein [Bacteroidota bacterium]
MDTAQKQIKSKHQVVKDTYKICPKCGNFIIYIDKEKYCSVCGSEYIEMCPSCHEPIIYPVSRFCPVCGKQLINAE